MTWYLAVCFFIPLLGAAALTYQMYKLVVLDATCRGLEHPKIWGLFAGANQNKLGLIAYFIFRQKYPDIMSAEQKATMSSRKNKAIVSLIFTLVGTVVLFAVIIFTQM